jgi:carbonic anhydrase/acetyltransferase-like protein (isoleucine patch superfamily)
MIASFEDKKPVIGVECFVAPGAWVMGDVVLGAGSSVWFQSVVRGDVHSIRIGKNTNIQDLSMVHVTNADAPKPAPTVIGDEVTVGHRVILHGCTVGDRTLIGMGAVLLDGVVVATIV